MADVDLDTIFPRSVIKSIQTGSISLSSGAPGTTSNTATISSVTTSKAVVLLNGATNNENTAPSATSRTVGSLSARVVLTNATTVTATRDDATNAPLMAVHFTVVEFQ